MKLKSRKQTRLWVIKLTFYIICCPICRFLAWSGRSASINIQDKAISLEVLDGLPGIVPFGVDNGALKHISRTIEAWMQVDNLENQLPYYRLKATPGDTEAVHAIQSGNFALAFSETSLLPVIADPTPVFGLDTSHARAHRFHDQGLDTLLSASQVLEGRTLCAFFGANLAIEPGEVQTLTSIYGYTRSLPLIESWVEKLQSPGFIGQKLTEARELAVDLTQPIQTESASPYFDGYCRQTFLDNLIRGGYPLILGGKNVTHVFSRKHGDIERDYNDFLVPPEYYSQGNGNYRDVNQNRRSDVFFVPQAGEFNIRLFMSLIQADGYNPLVIKGLTFSFPAEKISEISPFVGNAEKLTALLQRRFTPGELLDVILAEEISTPAEAVFEKVFSLAQANIQAEHGEGYWVDHWTYNLDLIDAYLAIYPDRKKALLFESEPLAFYDNAAVVQPRRKRYVLYQGKPRQLNALVKDLDKAALLDSRPADPHWARTDHGQGQIFHLPLISKLALLAVIKFATLDPGGMGIQMEAGRPGWYDALNGLPGLFGSSMPETCELLRLVKFLIGTLDEVQEAILLPEEAKALTDAISQTLAGELNPMARWAELTDALEAYRDSTRMGFGGGCVSLQLSSLLISMRERLLAGIAEAQSYGKGLLPTYFVYDVQDYALTGTEDGHGHPHISVKAFEPFALPAFLEGPVRLLKISDSEDAVEIARAIRQSKLFDRKLGMIKLNAPLTEQSHEIGRARSFTPGWLENESIWTHMAFKYLLELLRAGLYEEFIDLLISHLPPFMDPATYGRSPLENSSFVVSSAHPDATLHGNGFVARLSGATAEFLSMWTQMTAGAQPFQLENGQLVLALKPILPGWLFTEEGTFSFCFLGCCDVTLHNPIRQNTFNEGCIISRIELHANTETISIKDAIVRSPYAERVRSGEYDSIDVYFT
jgi:hypothetical protein